METAKCLRNDAQDVLDLDPPGLDALDKITNDGLRNVHCDRRMHQLPSEIQAIDGAFQFPAALRQPVCKQGDHVSRYLEGRVGRPLLLGALFQYLQSQRRVHGADLGDKAALQA